MDSNLKKSLLHFAAAAAGIAALVYLNGCATEQARFHRAYDIPAVRVHIVSDRSLFDAWQARNERSGIAAYADGSSIWMLGFEYGGKTFITEESERFLGHEMWEHMRINNKSIGNPHDKKFWMK